MGDVVLYEVDEGERRMLFGTPIEERDPEQDYPLSGFRGGYGTASGLGLLMTTTLYDDTGTLAYFDLSRPGEVEQVTIDGLATAAPASSRVIDHLEGDRVLARLQHRRLLLGVRRSARRELRAPSRSTARSSARTSSREAFCTGLDFDEESGRFVASFCTATSPTQLHVLPAEASPPIPLTRERALGPRPGAPVRR